MSCDREQVLENFLKSDILREKVTLSKDDLTKIRFGEESGDILIEALKTMIFSYCRDDSTAVILKNINNKIKKG